MGYFPKARHSQNDSENDDGRATGLGRAGRNDGGAAAASMGNRLGIPRYCPCATARPPTPLRADESGHKPRAIVEKPVGCFIL